MPKLVGRSLKGAAVAMASGSRFVRIEELTSAADEAMPARVIYTPACLHGFSEGPRPRFSSATIGQSNVMLREWHVGHEVLGFTLNQEQR